MQTFVLSQRQSEQSSSELNLCIAVSEVGAKRLMAT